MRVLAKHLVESREGAETESNVGSGKLVLTDSQAIELFELIEAYLSQEQFRSRSRFIDGLSDRRRMSAASKKSVRRLYIEGAREYTTPGVMESMKWRDFQVRFGVKFEDTMRAKATRMNIEYFGQMERKLFNEVGLHPDVVELAMGIVEDNMSFVEDVRKGNAFLEQGSTREVFERVGRECRGDENQYPWSGLINRGNVASAIIVVSNLSTLFTTRDWTVTGTLSAIAGSAAHFASN